MAGNYAYESAKLCIQGKAYEKHSACYVASHYIIYNYACLVYSRINERYLTLIKIKKENHYV